MKQKWNRLLASLLCAVLLCSDLSGLMPRASAAPDPAAATVVTDTGDQDDFRNESNGRPNLFVDFLGDNNNYIYTQGGANAGLTPRNPTNLNNISVPAPYDQSGYTNPTGPGNDQAGAWFQYKHHPDCDDGNLNKTVFWVGLGVDRTQLLELVRDGTGLSSLEAGFYYDSTIIEPYIDYSLLGSGVTAATATEAQKREAYQRTIQKANIANAKYPANTQWSSDYQILRALPGVEPPETDEVTREELETATMNDIMNNTLYTTAGQSQWKMTYVSLELKDVENAAADRRLAGVYKGIDGLDKGVDDEGNEAPILPASAQGDQYIVDGDASSGYDYNYLLLIPFRLKNYGSVDWTPLRLVRDATHFSIGGGTWGVDDYGAWERTTTRNGAVAGSAGDANTLSVEAHPDRDLKLLTRFAGDLNLFSTGRTAEYEYDALLRIIGDGGSLNHAKLTVKGDPAVWPVWADTNGDVIGGLQSGQGMHLDVHTQDNYVATVTVTYIQDDGNGAEELVYHQYTQTASGAHDNSYEFVMPAFVPVGARRVTVTVAFTYKAGDDALIYLTEVPQPGDADHAVGNETTIRTSLDSAYDPTTATETINSYSPTTDHPNYSHPGIDHPKTPVANAKKDQYVEIEVETHADYAAVVQIYDFKAQSFLTGGLTIDAVGASGVTPDLTDIDNPAHLADPTDPAHPAKIPSGRITLPQGGTIRLRMGSQDLDVIVTYEKGSRRQATLEVYNTNGAATNFDLNTAQLVYDLYDALNQPSKAYSAVTYHDYDTTAAVNPDDHRAIHPTKGGDKLPWVSASQGSLSGSLGGDTGRAGKVWDPMTLPTAQQELLGGKSVMALLASAAQKSDFRDAINGMDLAGVQVIPGLTGLRKNPGKELYGDPDVAAALDVDIDKPTVIDALWELRQAIDADTTTGGLKDTYLKEVKKAADNSVAYTYYDLTPAQLQAYLLEIFDAAQVKAANDLAYRIAQRRYLTILSEYNAVKDIPAYAGMAELKAPAVNLSTTVTNGVREYQGDDYKNTYLAQYDTYLDDYEAYLRALEANAGTGGSGAPTAPTSYPGPTAPNMKTISLKTDTAAVAAVAAYGWKPAAVPTQVPTGQQGNTIETRSGRTVYIALEADSAYELDTANTDIFQRGPGPNHATGARIAAANPVPVPGYQNVYAFTMPDQDCVVRVAYKLRGTRQLNITYKGAAGLDDNEAIVEAYSVADPPAVTPKLNIITNKGYTTTTLPSGGSYDAFNDVYVTDPVKDAFKGSTVTIRAKAAEGYEVKSVEAKNSDDTVITVTKRPADDPADGDVYTFIIPEGREDDVNLVITYGPEVDETFTATIQSTTEGAIDGTNKATWYVQNSGVVTTPTVISNVRPTTHLIGHVTVAPGYYIKSVTAWGASGNYPYTITGNGYNNGFGTSLTGANVPIEIFVDMPHEDLVVDVVFAKGPPEPAPDNTLTLIVKDDDNTEVDPSKAAANWARAKVFDQRPTGISTIVPEQDLPTVGALPGDQLGKNADHGAGTLTDRKYVETGKWVLVDFSAAVVMKKDTSPGAPAGAEVVDTEKSYYVSSVTVGPDHLGVALVWEGSSAVSFYMPAGSTAVTVEFSKYPANGRLPDYVLTVRETYTDLNPGAATPPNTDQYSYITSARSATIGLWSTIPEGGTNVPGRALDWNTNPELVPPRDEKNGTGAATAGEKVTMTFDVDIGDGTAANPGWYYQSVVLISNGAGTRLSDNVTEKSRATKVIAGKTTTVVTYQVEFYMPASPAEFVVNYRKGPKPTTPDYAFTLIIDDPHNVMDDATKLWDENSVSASFQDPTGAAGTHSALDVGHNKASMSAVQHIHADDIVTLKTTIANGYYLEYMIVNPAGLKLIPVWSDANTASFTMPKEGVAVVARVVKGTPQQYTANLILRYDGVLPTGKTIHDVGRGTFVLPDEANPGGTLGSLDDYAKKAIYSTVQLPGTDIPYDLYAFDGYYIDRVTVEPAILGVTGTLSGSCGYQDGDVIMPHASINVNVWFKKGWPDEIPYDLTIKVHDSSLDPAKTPNANDNNYAALRTVAGRAPAPVVASGDKTPVFGGQTKLVDGTDYILDRDTVILDIHTMPGFHVDSSNIKITDTLGDPVAWWYVPGGVAFTQPPRSVVADITFKQGEPDKKYTATLHLGPGMVTGDHSAEADIINDYVLLSAQTGNTHATTTSQAAGTTAPPAAVNTDTAVITDLYHSDALDLSVRPGAGRHITSAYAVSRATGAVIPIYGYDAAGDLSAIAVQYVPGKAGVPADNSTTPPTPAVPGTATKGAFAMPESDVDVYVNYADGTISATDMVVKLVVSGPNGAGSATADITEPAPSTGQSMSVAAPGVDTRFTAQGNQAVVTFDPAAGYGIAKLEVTNNSTGAPVPYDWISVLQDPPVVDNTDGNGNPQDNTDLWPGVAPAPGVTHPTYKPNPDKQIKLIVPSGGVTIHVTYATESTEPFKAQVVVNDPLAGDPNSRNDAGFPKDVAGQKVLERLKYATPGQWIDLDITVHPGYRIEYVKVVPQSFGIVPGLPIGTDMGSGVTYYLHDQSTGFTMPSGDVTVYVKFVADGVDTKNVTLAVVGAPTGNTANHATITSPASGTKGPVYVQGKPQSVSARPKVDWVDVDYQWDVATSAVASITVQTAADGTNVPFTQVVDPATGQGKLTFPMVSDDVIVTITYKDDPTPVGQEIVLHVIDKDRDATKAILLDNDNYGRLQYAGNAAIGAGPDDTGKVGLTQALADAGTFAVTETIHVPAGQSVDVTACSNLTDPNGPVYIESAYVLFEQNGQMVHFNLTPDSLLGGAGPGYSGLHDPTTDPQSFVVHPGRNDVYVTLTRKAPKADEHAAVLMLRSPASDTQSEAGIHADQSVTAWNDADPLRRDKVRVNDPADSHAYVTATDGEKITISVEPATGYVIDYVQITPLGFPLDTDPVYHFDRTGNTITFDMPHVNVAVTVYLKRGSDTNFKATLHYIQDPACLGPGKQAPQVEDYAKLSWTPIGEPTESIWADAKPTGNPGGSNQPWSDVSSMIVKEGSTVTLDVTLDTNPTTGKSDVILAAFVVWKDRGSIVTLTPSYPAGLSVLTGLEGVTESASGAPDFDNSLADATGSFKMPMGDVEVYVVVTTDPPTDPWHTVALVATDHSPTGNNSGLNEGDLWNHKDVTDKRVAKSDNVPTIAWVTVTETETISVLPRAAAGYRFDDPAVMTGNDGITQNLTTPYTNFLYEVTSILCNQVIRIDFESGDDLTLTVEIEDPDNPGDGTVEQVVTADPAGTTPPTLRLTSTSVAGSYQIMKGVTAGGDVKLTAKPYKDAQREYSAYATLYYIDGTSENVPLTDADNDGVWEGSFPMPANNARVVITFYDGYTGTLTLVNRISGDATGQAAMTEDKRGLPPLAVHSLRTSDSFQSLPNATKLDAYVTSSMTGRTVKGLLTRNGLTTILPATHTGIVGDPDHFYHTIDRADAEITLILDSPTEHPDSYLAAVDWVNLPAGTAHPEIEDKTSSQLRGSDKTWTTATRNDTVEVTLNVPYGYKATVRADGTDVTLSAAGPFYGPAAPGTPNVQTVTFPMPARDVQITVTYAKTIFDLTLRVIDTTAAPTANTTSVTPAAADVVGALTSLTASGQTTQVRHGGNVAVSAAPSTGATAPAKDPHIVAVYYQTASGTTHWLEPTALAAGTPSSKSFTMPEDDVVVTVIYDDDHAGKPEDDYYIATVVVDDPTNHPGNKAVSIVNIPAAGLPSGSPNWAAGHPGSGMKVSYEVADGYHVTATAKRADTNADLPVLQLGSTANGTASATMPAANIVITLTYEKGEPPKEPNNVALQLLGHKAQAANEAATSNFTDPTQLSGLATTGVTPNFAPHAPAYTHNTDPVETVKSAAKLGDDLRTLAGSASGSQVVRMTVAVRKVTYDTDGVTVLSVAETPEVDLLVSKYADSATSRAPAPITHGPDEEIVIRVYYGNIYKAIFHLVGEDATDGHTATDTVPYTSAYNVSDTAISKPIQDHLDRFEGYQGDGAEDIQTTATAGPGRRVVDVVWESDLTGAASATFNGARPTDGSGRYDFTMPEADVDFYAFFEKEPDDPDDRAYVAKVAFAKDSQHLDDSDNAVSIKNLTNDKALGGKYWTEARDQDSVEVTVKVAAGFQAEIITTKIDDDTKLGDLPDIYDGTNTRKPLTTDDYQYYISRTQFIYNLPAGKEATFTMPKDTDATVTVKFTKGYDLTMRLRDRTRFVNADPTNVKASNVAVSTTGYGSITNTASNPGDGSAVTVTASKSVPTASAARMFSGMVNALMGQSVSLLAANPYAPGTNDPDTLYDLPGNLKVTTAVTLDTLLGTNEDVTARLFRTTPFTGTQLMAVNTKRDSANPASLEMMMGYEDTLGTTELTNSNELYAAVQTEGERDIEGNVAKPIYDYTNWDVDNKKTTQTTLNGTKTDVEKGGNTVDLSITIQKGYVARVKVRRDDQAYLDNPNDPTKWNYLDGFRYHFASDYQYDDAGTLTWGHDDLVSDPGDGVKGERELGVTEVVLRPDDKFRPQSTFPGSVCGVQHFRFTMPQDAAETGAAGTDGYVMADTVDNVTVIVTFEKISTMPQPFDPRNVNKTVRGVAYDHQPGFLEEGFIYGENRGAYAIVEIPTLAMDEESVGKHLYDTDNYDEPASGKPEDKKSALDVQRFTFAIRTVSATGAVSYERLEPGVDVELMPWREDELVDPADPYNYYVGKDQGMWSSDDSRYWETNPKDKGVDHDFVGSKFKLYPTEPDPKTGKRTAGAQALYEMLNDQGSLETYTEGTATKYRTRLVVRAEDAASMSEYTEVWIRPWFALGVKVNSYGPTHPVEGKLYRLMTQDELDVASGYKDKAGTILDPAASVTLDPDDFQHYKWDEDAEPTLEDSIVLEGVGSGKWLQILRMRSSELLGGFDSSYDPREQVSDPAKPDDRTLLDNVPAGQNLVYALEIEKISNLTYTRVKLDLDPHSADYAAPNAPLTDYYEETGGKPDYTTRTFMLQDTVQLIAGDVDQNGATKVQDYDAVYDFVYRSRKWSDVKTEPVEPAAGPDPAYTAAMAQWAISVYNPDSAAYRCDLDGDRRLTVVDLNIVNTRFNYNRTAEDYHWYYQNGSNAWQSRLPFGMGPRDDTTYDALFALRSIGEGEIFTDPFWDETVDPAELSALPLETFFIGSDGVFRLDTEIPELPAVPTPDDDERAENYNERVETPVGEDALGQESPAVLPETEALPWEPEEPAAGDDPPTGEDSTQD